jgi:ribonuclease-3
MRFFLFKALSPEDKNLSNSLKSILSFKPRNLELYKNALRHSSAGVLRSGEIYNNERLEFVGDSIISAVVSDILYLKFPRANEGKLSILRSTIVNRKSLNEIATVLKIDNLIVFRNSAKASMKNMAGNSFEALVGAIYFDRGYKYAKIFISKVLTENFDIQNLMRQNSDYKSRLLQIMQKYKLNISINTFENCESNEKTHHFYCEICYKDLYLAEGKGWSKKEAEQNASRIAVKKLKEMNFSNY